MKRIAVIALRHPEHEGLFLHGLRRDNGRWSLPGGHAKDGENMDEAARRELREETNLQVTKLEAARNGTYPSPDGEINVTLFMGTAGNFLPEGDNDPDEEFLTFKFMNPDEIVNAHVPKERNILLAHINGVAKAEDLGKMGANQRLFPFNPVHDVYEPERREIDDWQRYAYNDDENLEEGSGPRDIRESLTHMHHNANARAMNRIMGWTNWRSNPETNEREFLLHRGMSNEEFNSNVNPDDGIVHHKGMRSSWTPDYQEARDFAGGAKLETTHPEEHSGYRVVSAWIPESKIVHVPKMYGRMEQYGKQKGPNSYDTENEIIVAHNHRSKLHIHRDPLESAAAPDVPHDPHKKLHSSITHRQPQHIIREIHARNAFKQAQQRAQESIASLGTKKLAASEVVTAEVLEKMPKIFTGTPKKPFTTVIRVQNAQGHGPYGSVDAIEHHSDYDVGPHGDTPSTPAPTDDPGFHPSDLKQLSGVNKPHVFGFENEQQMHGWFHPHEIEAMAAEGFKPTKIKAAHVWSSGKQVFFQRYVEPHRAKKAGKKIT